MWPQVIGLLKDGGGIPTHGNQQSEWDAGCRFDYPNLSTASEIGRD